MPLRVEDADLLGRSLALEAVVSYTAAGERHETRAAVCLQVTSDAMLRPLRQECHRRLERTSKKCRRHCHVLLAKHLGRGCRSFPLVYLFLSSVRLRRAGSGCRSDRALAEAAVRADAVGLAGIHVAAGLAQQGSYRAARVQMLSTQRLLERSARAEMNFKLV